MGYRTAHTIAKLKQPKKADEFVIEAMKLKHNAEFQQKFQNVDLNFGPGDRSLLNDISKAAEVLYMDAVDTDTIQKKVYDTILKKFPREKFPEVSKF